MVDARLNSTLENLGRAASSQVPLVVRGLPEWRRLPDALERDRVMEAINRRASPSPMGKRIPSGLGRSRRLSDAADLVLALLTGVSVSALLFAPVMPGPLPIWTRLAVMALSAMLLVVAFRRTMRRMRGAIRLELSRRGYPVCARCGYDLTGTVRLAEDGGMPVRVTAVCPECGRRCRVRPGGARTGAAVH